MASMSASFVCQGSVKAVVPVSRSNGRSAGGQKLSSFAGLKASNVLTALGSCVQCVDQRFAQLQAECKIKSSKGGGSRGGALSAKASVSEEVFRVVPIMSVLVLVGISVGFLLLRVEQAVEEAEDG